ncbi:hypothetical protein AVEN_151653-1 [Araneus ventricosus]|uniref:Uncharacterized protein n=1 Tax=Araneus ventricosus TaxID=182803 RepID=A0A4Y2JV39_ARAVE|nr:hypothetical protein AVEN_151653-1 [Araneus ventricosus]
MDDKSANTITYNIDKEKSPKDINVYGNESKPGCSRYISPSAKGSITSSPTFEANTNSPIRDVIDLGRDRLSYKPSKRSPPTNLSSATLSSPRIQNFDSNTLVIVHIAHKISMIKADYVSEKLQMNILSLITIASELVKQLGSWKMDVAIDIQHWVINFQEIRKIISQNEPLVSNDKPLVTMEFLHAYEEDMKTIWKKLDVMMMVADCKRRLFLTTEPNFQKFINLFLECLVTVGILKPYSPPTL